MQKAHTLFWSLQKQLLKQKGDRVVGSSVSIGRYNQ